MKVVLCVTNNLQNDQRVLKTAISLSKIANIQLVGRNFPKVNNSIIAKFPTKLFRLIFNHKFLFYAEYNLRLFFYLLFKRFDVAAANDADTLPAVFWACKLKNKKMVFDSHEIFSEVPELVYRPRIKQFWKRIEDFYIPKIECKTAVSQSIIDYYQQKYDTKFMLLRNLPLENHQRNSLSFADFNLPEHKKVILYQGALNVGRGLELAINCLPFLPVDYILVLAGKGDIQDRLLKQVRASELESRVFFLGQIMPTRIKQLTPLAHVGLSIEEDLGLNYRYALPNKLFDYIQAGIPVIVSDLPEMRKIVRENKIGFVLKERKEVRLAEQISMLIPENKTNFEIKENLVTAARQFIWSIDEKNLLNIYKKLIL